MNENYGWTDKVPAPPPPPKPREKMPASFFYKQSEQEKKIAVLEGRIAALELKMAELTKPDRKRKAEE